ncbi:MAG: hypothetical protein NT025_09205 [bacterium]|nr:hypothetical protein [bacterium]
MKFPILLAVLLPLVCSAQPAGSLILPESPRVMGMGGAYVGLADDPMSGIVNPAGLRSLKKLGTDFFFAKSSPSGPDHFCFALANPSTEKGSPVAMGVWSQGLISDDDRKFYVPYAALSYELARFLGLGLVTRFPYVATKVDSEKSRWETVADVSARLTVSTIEAGAAVERCFGGAQFVARRLRAGAAFASQQGIAVSYEWRALETDRRFDFHYESSHWGAELPVGKYVALRGGYAHAERTHFAAGLAVGVLRGGWRVETACEFPASGKGRTRWAAGLNYRL